MNTRGFTLIEWLIYFFLIISVLTGIFHFVATTQQRVIKLGRRSRIIAQLTATHDLLARDIASSPSMKDQWNQIGPDALSWQQDDEKISWSMQNQNLYRTKSGSRRAVVARGLSRAEFVPKYNVKQKHLRSITCILEATIDGQACFLERTASLQNRVIE